jgi:hypothetical protein
MNPQAGQDDQDYWKQQDQGLGAVQPDESPSAEEASRGTQPISWQASEAVHHEKDVTWFIGVIVVAVLLLALSIFVVKSWTFTGLIVVMAVAVGVIGTRPPRVLQYQLSAQSLRINEKQFSLHDFRAFGIMQEDALYSVVLIPHKRFMPSVNVYFPAENGEEIVDVFGEVLPMEHVEPDILDRLSRKLHL